eukprot:2883816-Alexandrium_andersonii.AAC.1
MLCRGYDCNYDNGIRYASFLELLHDGPATGGYQSTMELFVMYNVLAGLGRVDTRPADCPLHP